MAAGLFAAAAARVGLDVSVASAGLLAGGCPAPDEVVSVMADIGLDLSGHRSQQLDESLLGEAGLVVAMTRQHVISVVGDHPQAWPKVFRLHEVLERAAQVADRLQGTDLAAWVSRLHAGRKPADILVLDGGQDIADPMGQRRRAYERTRDELAAKVGALADSMARATSGRPVGPSAPV